MKDFAGKELKVGDDVVYLKQTTSSSHLVKGRISRFTNKFVFMADGARKEPNKVVKVIL